MWQLSQSCSQSSPSMAGSTCGKRVVVVGALVNPASRLEDEDLGVRKALPFLIRDGREGAMWAFVQSKSVAVS